MIGIYRITEKEGIRAYIGSSTNIIDRKKAHLKILKAKNHHAKNFQKLYNKGIKFNFEILYVINKRDFSIDPKRIITLEQKYIDRYINKYGRRNLLNSSTNAYNCVHDPEIAAKINKTRRGTKFRKAISEANRRRGPRSEETKLKISKTKKGNIESAPKTWLGKKFSKKHRQAISDGKKGGIPWNKGKNWSKEIKQKISKTLTGRKLSKTHKNNLRKAKRK